MVRYYFMLPIVDSRILKIDGKYQAKCNCGKVVVFTTKANCLKMLNRKSCRNCKRDYKRFLVMKKFIKTRMVSGVAIALVVVLNRLTQEKIMPSKAFLVTGNAKMRGAL